VIVVRESLGAGMRDGPVKAFVSVQELRLTGLSHAPLQTFCANASGTPYAGA
jgi:hypothetical protein